MIDETNQNEIIEKYLQGELTGQHLEAFEAKLAASDELRKEVALEKAIIRNLKTAGRAAMRSKLESIHLDMGPVLELQDPEQEIPVPEQEMQPSPLLRRQVLKMNTRQYVLMAAASIALVLASTFTLRSYLQNRHTPEAIFESYYEPFDDIAVMRGIPTQAAIKNEAALAYNERNYQKSIQLFKIVLEKEKDEEALFYLGNAYLSANMPLEAINTFEDYLRTFNNYKTEATWYLGLSYLKAGKNQKARKLLEDLAAAPESPENPYRDKASEILSKYEGE